MQHPRELGPPREPQSHPGAPAAEGTRVPRHLRPAVPVPRRALAPLRASLEGDVDVLLGAW